MNLDEIRRLVGIRKIDYCAVVRRGLTEFEYSANAGSKDELHRTNSITKSVVSLLVGIAIDDGILGGVGEPISAYLPEYAGQEHSRITIERLLTMTPGWDWPEMGAWRGLPTPMTDSPDWVRYVLSRPFSDEPGAAMRYDSGSSQLLSAILQRATGKKTSKFAEDKLFGKLGIETYEWPEDPQGVSIGGFGLCLKPPDLTKLGLLMLGKGSWLGESVVSSRWVEECTVPRYHTYDHIGSYGYHWWIMTDGDRKPVEPRAYFAMGFGGQLVFVVPDRELVAAFAGYLGIKHRFLALELCRNLYRSLDQ